MREKVDGKMRKMPYMKHFFTRKESFAVCPNTKQQKIKKKRLKPKGTKYVEKQSNKHKNYEQKYFQLQVSLSLSPANSSLFPFDEYFYVHISPHIEKRVKSDSKIYKKKSSTFKRQSIQSKSLVAFFSSSFDSVVFFFREKRQRTTFAAALLLL